MDTSADEFELTPTGCNFCDIASRSLADVKKEAQFVNKLIADVKKDGVGKQYDCLIGLSGGVDSSFMLLKAIELDLRPLCYSIDNGWQYPTADENIMRLVEGLKVPFYRYTIDIPKFRQLQAAFLQAGQKNLEIPTDHILMASSYQMAVKYDIKWIVSGGNVATESIMPASWGYQPRDLTHIKSVFRRDLKGLPTCGLLKWNKYKWWNGIKTLYLLDYFEYNREDAVNVLHQKFGYQSYGDKHCESIWTSWFQNFYLFEKFGIDKRKAHLSSLIVSGQISRKEALDVLETSPVYPQLGIEARAMSYPIRDYKEFKTDEKVFGAISRFVRFIKK